MTEALTLLCASDSRYGQHLGVALFSMLTHHRGSAPVEVYILNDGLPEIDVQRLLRLAERFGAHFHFIPIDPQQVVGLKVSTHITAATYFRLFAAQLLPKHVEKVLYLDSDIVVLDDVMEIWETDIAQYALAAVMDQGDVDETRLNLPASECYFNGGILLINLLRWREEKIGETVLKFVRDNPDKILVWDQDGMNAILHSRWLPLPLRWNVQSALWYPESFQNRSLIGSNEKRQAKKNPAIVHFTGSSKPWHFMNAHPLRHLYFRYLRSTEWRAFRQENRTLLNYVRKYGGILYRRARGEPIL